METGDSGRTTFMLEWYDRDAEKVRPFIMFCYPDNTIELVDTKQNRVFLKRTTCPTVVASRVMVGGVVNVFRRQMDVVGYGDEFTRRRREKEAQRTLAVLKPDVVKKMGRILEIIQENGFNITKLKSVRMTQSQAESFYEHHKGKHFLPALLTYMTSGPVVAVELVGYNAVARWKHLMGPTDPATARRESPCSLRATFGRDSTINSLHGSASIEVAEYEIGFFFPEKHEVSALNPKTTATMTNEVTSCIVRPHVINESGTLGRIIEAIYQNNFTINAIQMFKLSKPNAQEFLEIYKGVVPNYNEIVEELSSGPCVVMEIGGFREETQQRFRFLCGPRDPHVGRQLREDTLRARFGTDKLLNAVHCTDLPEDGLLECAYFFCLLMTRS